MYVCSDTLGQQLVREARLHLRLAESDSEYDFEDSFGFVFWNTHTTDKLGGSTPAADSGKHKF